MDREVDEVVTRDVRPAPAIVQRQREIQQWPAFDCEASARRRAQRTAQTAEALIRRDRAEIVENERSVKAVMIGNQPSQHECATEQEIAVCFQWRQ